MLFDRQTYVVKERVAFAKLTATYDLLDAANAAAIGIAKEEPPAWAKWLRLIVNKHMLPTVVNVYEGTDGGQPILSIRRGFTFLRARVAVDRPLVHDSRRAGERSRIGQRRLEGMELQDPDRQRRGARNHHEEVGRRREGALHERRHLRDRALPCFDGSPGRAGAHPRCGPRSRHGVSREEVTSVPIEVSSRANSYDGAR